MRFDGRLKGSTIAMTMYDYIIKEWMQTFELIDIFKEYKFDHIIITLENFVNKNKTIAINEWNKLFGFILNDKYFNRNYDELRKRMECVNIIGNKHDKMRVIHRKKINMSDNGLIQYMTINEAYDFLRVKYICRAWDKIKHIAIKYNYKIWPKHRGEKKEV